MHPVVKLSGIPSNNVLSRALLMDLPVQHPSMYGVDLAP